MWYIAHDVLCFGHVFIPYVATPCQYHVHMHMQACCVYSNCTPALTQLMMYNIQYCSFISMQLYYIYTCHM